MSRLPAVVSGLDRSLVFSRRFSSFPFNSIGWCLLQSADCGREQSLCEADLAREAGRLGPGPGRPGRPVCGSDNATYVNDCALKRAQCEGRSVEVAHRGKCKGKSG